MIGGFCGFEVEVAPPVVVETTTPTRAPEPTPTTDNENSTDANWTWPDTDPGMYENMLADMVERMRDMMIELGVPPGAVPRTPFGGRRLLGGRRMLAQ
jgi:hypothetical protein